MWFRNWSPCLLLVVLVVPATTAFAPSSSPRALTAAARRRSPVDPRAPSKRIRDPLVAAPRMSSHEPEHHAGSGHAEHAAAAGTGGDRLRAATAIRPSLHPTTINAISDALLLRSSAKKSVEDPIDVWADGAVPLQVALTAGKIAADALEKRTVSCHADGDEASIPTPDECQVVAGRVVGVVMRLRDLEEDLVDKVGAVGWVKRYGEYGTFGVLKSECDASAETRRVDSNEASAECSDGVGVSSRTIDPEREKELCERIRDDPLFRMCRAECILALFIENVEIPKLEEVGEQVAGGSAIDFIDEDRKEVLLS